jgi:hypothetical protein
VQASRFPLLILGLHRVESSWKANGRSAGQELTYLLWPCSKEPATRLLPEPVQASPHHQILFRWDLFEYSPLIYSRCTSAFPIKTMCAVLTSMFFYMTRSSHQLWFDHPNNKLVKRKIYEALIMQFSLGKHRNKRLPQITCRMRRNSGSFNKSILSSVPIIPQFEFLNAMQYSQQLLHLPAGTI